MELGIATFGDLVINTANTNYQLQFSADVYGTVNSDPFDVVAAGLNSLTIFQEPTPTTAGQPIQGPPVVQAQDIYGNLINGLEVTVSEIGYSYPFDAGTLTQTTDGDGIAVFADLVINTPGNNYQLQFSADDASVNSILFDVVPPTEVWVDDDWQVGPLPYAEDTDLDTDFATIQAAVNAVDPYDIVHVLAGTYNENIILKDGVEVLGAGASVTTIDGTGSGSVVTASNVGSATKLDGFTITGGDAVNGGGMYNNYPSSPTVSNCTFSDNSADYGGGMYNYESSPTVSNCAFSDNSAGWGGGMYNYEFSPAVTNCTFSGNTATSDGGGMWNFESSPTVSNCAFSDNLALNGGGMYNGGSSPTVTNCTFSGNTATSDGGGGMYNYASPSTVTNCTFSGNTATNLGGGMYNYPYSPTVTNCTFSGNTADSGGGMYNGACEPTVTNCTFSGNTATDSGGGMYNSNSSPVVTNCILGDEIYNDGTSAPAVTYCDVQGGYTGTGNINEDPLFVDPGAGDYHLTSASPCIDAGDNTAPSLPSTDFEGDDRILDGDDDGSAMVDMGVDEYEYAPPPPPTEVWVDDDWEDQDDVDAFNPSLIWQYDAFNEIQDGVDAVDEGADNTVHVLAGDYIEHVTIDKSLTVESVSGDWHDTEVSPGDESGNVFAFPADFDGDATISGLEIDNGDYGVYINGLGEAAALTSPTALSAGISLVSMPLAPFTAISISMTASSPGTVLTISAFPW